MAPHLSILRACAFLGHPVVPRRCWSQHRHYHRGAGDCKWRLTQCPVHSTASLACLDLLRVARTMERGPQHLRLSAAEHGNISLKFPLVTIQPRRNISPVKGRSLRAQREQPTSVVTNQAITAITILCCAARIRGKRAALPGRRNHSMEVHDEHWCCFTIPYDGGAIASLGLA